MFNLTQAYQAALQSGDIQPDMRQQVLVQVLESLGQTMLNKPSRLKRWLFGKPSVSGVYIWGSVGCGKTYLMDLFYNHLPLEKKGRKHFHEFMHSLHKHFKQAQGQPNPIALVAKQIARDYQLLCLDELIVIDIADAMILGLLFQALFDMGVVLVITSNVEPDRLYWQGLQRDQFIPAIEAIKAHMSLFHLKISQDYRLRNDDLLRARYLTPLEGEESWMKARFDRLVGSSEISVEPQIIQGHYLNVLATGGQVLWCSFQDLCATPRVVSDYLLLIQHYQVICLSAIPAMRAEHDNEARRFIHLIDACYDQKCLVIASGEVPIESLYQGERLAQEFQRTISRLIEMQSWEEVE